MLSKFIAIAAALASTALAVPDVNATLIPGGCAAYPLGRFIVQIVDSGNSSIEGYGDTQNWVLGASEVAFAYLTFPERIDEAKMTLQCTDDVLTAQLAHGVGGDGYYPLQVSPYPYDATIGYDFGNDSTPVKPFTHTIDGVQQDGVYLGGYDNKTTWGVKYNQGGAYNQNYFYVRLLGPNSADPSTGKPLSDGEFTAFIKVLNN